MTHGTPRIKISIPQFIHFPYASTHTLHPHYDPPNLNLDPNVPNRSLSGGFVGL